jgi:riboflavin synthase
MFTGLIEEIGRIQTLHPEGEGMRLALKASMAPKLQRGESVALDGVCLTVESIEGQSFTVFASGETLRRTTLGSKHPGDGVNLERALAVGDRLGGHWVQGHVDSTGTLRKSEEHGQSRVLTFSAPRSVLDLLVEKGSIAVDGISLTVAALSPDAFSVWIIPETWQATTLRNATPGQAVNLECDLIAKYVFRYLDLQRGATGTPAERDAALEALLRQGGWGTRDPSGGR